MVIIFNQPEEDDVDEVRLRLKPRLWLGDDACWGILLICLWCIGDIISFLRRPSRRMERLVKQFYFPFIWIWGNPTSINRVITGIFPLFPNINSSVLLQRIQAKFRDEPIWCLPPIMIDSMYYIISVHRKCGPKTILKYASIENN